MAATEAIRSFTGIEKEGCRGVGEAPRGSMSCASSECGQRGVPRKLRLISFEVFEDREIEMRRGSSEPYYIMESLILAQNERWRRVLSMQVER